VGGFSDNAGRRPAYIICLVIYVSANIGLALAPNFASLLVLRCLQSSGSSATVTLANAVAADIVTSAERGEYIAYTSVGAILAPSLAPVLGGILAQYAGWRWIFWFLVIFALSFFTPFLLFFPETCRKIVNDGSVPPPHLNHNVLTAIREHRLKKEGQNEYFVERDRLARDRHISFPNPMTTLRIIFSKTAGLALLGNGVLFCCYYAITSSLPSQFKLHYGLNDFQISLIFLPFGVGSLISAFTTGKVIDWNFRRHAKRLGLPVEKGKQRDLINFPIEKARIEIAIPMVILGAAGLLCYGWLIEKNVSIAGPCVFLFIVGYSITGGFNCMAILLIDMYPGKPAAASAANNLTRCWMGAGAAAAVIPLIERVGFGYTVTIASAIWIAFTPVLAYVMKKGPQWRKEARERNEAAKLRAQEELEKVDGMTESKK
jgi:multidrug resistance protein